MTTDPTPTAAADESEPRSGRFDGETATCARCGHGIVWGLDADPDDPDEMDEPGAESYGLWFRADTGSDVCTPGPGDEDHWHAPADVAAPAAPVAPVIPAVPSREDRYAASCAAAATAQGLDPITAALAAAGVAYDVEQTGGWVMAVTVPVPAGVFALTAESTDPDRPYVLGFFPGNSWHDGEADPEDLPYLDTDGLRVWAHSITLAQAPRP
jgi:hypothetical protein